MFTREKWYSRPRLWAVLGGAVLLSFGSSDAQEVTYADDVEPILYENCVQCHRTGSIAPMSLQTFSKTTNGTRPTRRKSRLAV